MIGAAMSANSGNIRRARLFRFNSSRMVSYFFPQRISHRESAEPRIYASRAYSLRTPPIRTYRHGTKQGRELTEVSSDYA